MHRDGDGRASGSATFLRARHSAGADGADGALSGRDSGRSSSAGARRHSKAELPGIPTPDSGRAAWAGAAQYQIGSGAGISHRSLPVMTGRTRDPHSRNQDYIQPMELDPSGAVVVVPEERSAGLHLPGEPVEDETPEP